MFIDSATEQTTAAIDLIIAAVAAFAGFTLIWPFDHNGVFHLVQMPAIGLLILGLRVRPEK